MALGGRVTRCAQAATLPDRGRHRRRQDARVPRPRRAPDGASSSPTGTKNLQDQIVEKDLPFVVERLGIPRDRHGGRRAATTILCLRRFHDYDRDPLLPTIQEGEALRARARSWAPGLDRRSRRDRPGSPRTRASGGASTRARRHLHGTEVRGLRGVLAHEGPPARRGVPDRRREPSSLLRGPRPARGRLRQGPSRLRRGDLRRGAPRRGGRDALPRRRLQQRARAGAGGRRGACPRPRCGVGDSARGIGDSGRGRGGGGARAGHRRRRGRDAGPDDGARAVPAARRSRRTRAATTSSRRRRCASRRTGSSARSRSGRDAALGESLRDPGWEIASRVSRARSSACARRVQEVSPRHATRPSRWRGACRELLGALETACRGDDEDYVYWTEVRGRSRHRERLARGRQQDARRDALRERLRPRS